MATVVYIDNQGNLSGLADDTLDKLTLGPKTVERVSNVEFDHVLQCWVATDMHGVLIASHPVRSVVIDMERTYLNKRIEDTFATTAQV